MAKILDAAGAKAKELIRARGIGAGLDWLVVEKCAIGLIGC